MEIIKKITLITAASLLGFGGLYVATTSANAQTPTAPTVNSSAQGESIVDAVDADDATESAEDAKEDATDGPESAEDAIDDAIAGK